MGRSWLMRSIWFSRINLHMARQFVYDAEGNILTDARYSDWQNYDGVPFPKTIDITRPQDEYAVVLTVVKMEINRGVSDDKFVLEQPEGTQLQELGQAGSRRRLPLPQRKPEETVTAKLVLENLKHKPMRSLLSMFLIARASDPDSVPGGPERRHAGRFRPARPRHRGGYRGAPAGDLRADSERRSHSRKASRRHCNRSPTWRWPWALSSIRFRA